MAARSAVSEMLRTRGSPVLILIAYLDFDRFPTLRLALAKTDCLLWADIGVRLLTRNVRDSLPNGSFIGFTGKPIEKTDGNMLGFS
jgi:hypothetical protein